MDFLKENNEFNLLPGKLQKRKVIIMNRNEVYKIVDGERAYQRKVWGMKGERRTNNGIPGQDHGHIVEDGKLEVSHDVGNWIVFMEYYLDLAKKALTTVDGHTAALHELRKVTALGIACFEQHGCPEREGQ